MKKVREIKFRVWDKYGKYMRYLGDDSHDSIEFFDENRASYYNLQCGDGGASTTEEDCDGYGFSPLMQYTGLKDKNGKEIYEGDIVKYNYNNQVYQDVYAEVEYSIAGFRLNADYISRHLSRHIRIADTDYYEVVGNIYENPELLTV